MSRQVTVSLRMTQEESTRMREDAARAGLTFSEHVRRAVLNPQQAAPRPAATDLVASFVNGGVISQDANQRWPIWAA